MYSQWCERMQQQAVDGTEAYNYFRLMQFWLERGLQRSFLLENNVMDKINEEDWGVYDEC